MKSITTRRRPAALTRHALLAAGLLGAIVSASAADEPAAVERSPSRIVFRIPAGPLADSITRYAAAAGVTLTFDPRDIPVIDVPALEGRYGVEEGFLRLLRGTGLTARYRQDTGSYQVEKLPDAATLMSAVRVEAASPVFDEGATDGSGSYAASRLNSANGFDLTPRQTPHSLSVVTRQQIEDQNLTSIFQALGQVPGVAVEHLDSERWSIGARGQDLNIMIDGSPAPNYLGGPSSEVMGINTATLDRVEVVRGAAGLMNGTGGYGGSVNLVRKRPLAGFHVNGAVAAGSWDRYQTQLDVSTDLSRDGRVRSRWVAATQDGDSFIDDYQRSERVLYGLVEADLGARTVASLGVEKYISHIDGSTFSLIPMLFDDGTRFVAPYSFNPTPPWSQTNVDNTTVFTDLRHQFNEDWSLKLAASWLDSEADMVRAGFSPWQGLIDKETGMAPMFRSLVWQQGDRYNLDLRLQGAFEAFGRRHELLLGANYHRAELGGYLSYFFFDDGSASVNVYDWPNQLPPYPEKADADSAYEQPNDQRQWALFGAMKFQLLDPLALIAGTRWQRTDNRSSWTELLTHESGSSRVRENGKFVPYAALMYDLLPTTTAYVSYTSIFNPTSSRDRDNQILSPEQGVNYEAGIKGEYFGGRLQPALSFYRQQVDNVAVEDTGYVLPGGDVAYRTADGVTRKGWDVTVAGEPLRGWTLQGGVGGEIDSSDRSQSRFFTLTTAWEAGERVSVGGNLTWKPKRQRALDYSEETVDLGSLTLLNLFASWGYSERLRLVLNVDNVTDEHYWENAGAYGGYVYGPPRSAMLTLRYSR